MYGNILTNLNFIWNILCNLKANSERRVLNVTYMYFLKFALHKVEFSFPFLDLHVFVNQWQHRPSTGRLFTQKCSLSELSYSAVYLLISHP